MRKLVAAIAFLAVTALPATALAQPHRGEVAQVTVYLERTSVGDTNWSHVQQAGAEWTRSSRLQVQFVKRCPRAPTA